jgi:ligand-binding sensor domain-containing protein
MKKYFLQTQTFALLTLFVFVNFCNGQPKIVKTQGTNQYANVHCGLQDKAGNLWFGTTGEGVYRYDGKSFINFTEKDGLSNNNVWCIYEDKDSNLWFGTGDGICRYDSSLSRGKGLKPFLPLQITESSDKLSAKKEIWSILEDKTGNFWFGTNDGVYLYNGKSFTHFLYNDSNINNNELHLKHIQSILEDKNGNIWFVSWNHEGVSRYDGKFVAIFTSKEGLGFDMVHSILQDKTGNIWIGTRNDGAYCYDGKYFIHFTENEDLSNSCVYSIAEDKVGNIWFATESSGVWCYNPSASLLTGSKSLTNFTIKDGLSHNSVFSIIVDNSGKLWFGTRGIGLCSYDGKQFTNYSE